MTPASAAGVIVDTPQFFPTVKNSPDDDVILRTVTSSYRKSCMLYPPTSRRQHDVRELVQNVERLQQR